MWTVLVVEIELSTYELEAEEVKYSTNDKDEYCKTVTLKQHFICYGKLLNIKLYT